ncbi:MAG: response regulator [Bryobacteraceae bacterium]|jgi:two-component system chemotaxis response regulator CheY
MAYRVLIVDDSPAMRALVRRVIRLSGVDVADCFEAGNGREALAVLADQWVDVILTDINMPEMDGEQFLERLQSEELLRSIPTVVISTDGTRHRVERLRELGACGYITKPFLPENLREMLERHLGVPHD